MSAILTIVGSILLLGLAAADLWVSAMSSDERSKMGLEK